jgi:deoxyadenosine/deoxycytidine kinase
MKVVIDGNIGSGKTTQLNMFDKMGFKVYKEPINIWPLDIFYSDISRWGLMFQLRVLQTLPEISWNNSNKRIEFYERCKWSALDVFWQYMLEKNQVTYWEDVVLRDAAKNYTCEPDLYIYLKSNPSTSYHLIRNRNQSGDSKIELGYLEDLDNLYERMFYNIQCKKLIIDTNGKSPEAIYNEILKAVKSRAHELHSFDT